MQVLKEEVRKSILQKAQETFLQTGFRNASMKDIAVKAGVAVGNLYRYYPNKEALFDAVTARAYDELTGLITEDQQKRIQSGLAVFEEVGRVLSILVQEQREGLLILLYGSAGTSREGFRERFFAEFAEHIMTHLADYNRSHPKAQLQMEVSRPLSVAFLEGYFEIMRTSVSQEQIDSLTRQYVSVWFMGLGKLI
ncbi:TetR/AcrR family transcriptional regulator [Paenibacillus sonchi]|uniref:TetR/AcrR family transcriptional regulator n=1 Tax=Paenibacillus sonchi TaxID=373687 RepID=UPI001E5E08C7|nr:TetR/AcrR family transcriptional regulator [Paenibacillus sonchi]MCE3200905.1 TetR/AcrR family transcriptional regulator [Paenibacillus sonchi]